MSKPKQAANFITIAQNEGHIWEPGRQVANVARELGRRTTQLPVHEKVANLPALDALTEFPKLLKCSE